MKLKFERFDGLGCFYIRGTIEHSHFKLLSLGLEALVKTSPEPVVVNLTNATLNSTGMAHLIQLKKQLEKVSTQKASWIHKDRTLGDYGTVDLMVSRMNGSKFRQIGDRIKVDDEVYAFGENLKQLEAKEKTFSESGHDASKLILENRILKERHRILKECIVWQEARLKAQKAVPSTDEEVNDKIKDTKKDFKKVAGEGVDL